MYNSFVLLSRAKQLLRSAVVSLKGDGVPSEGNYAENSSRGSAWKKEKAQMYNSFVLLTQEATSTVSSC
jgi:hypothetical protein